jgi:hypothetical protein
MFVRWVDDIHLNRGLDHSGTTNFSSSLVKNGAMNVLKCWLMSGLALNACVMKHASAYGATDAFY